MALKEIEKKEDENILNLLSTNLKLRFGDVFFSYFIIFEIVYNWQFFYALLIKDKEKADAVIKYASTFLTEVRLYAYVYDFLDKPSSFTLSLLSASVMCLVYPFIQFGILKVRKMIFYYTNKNLEKDYPTRLEFSESKNEVEKSYTSIREMNTKRVYDVGSISNVIFNQDVVVQRKTISYSIVVGKEQRHFKEDEIVQVTTSNNFIVERPLFNQADKRNLYLVVRKITEDVLLVAKINGEIPVTQAMHESGYEIFAMTKYGRPAYLTNEEFKEQSQYGREFLFFARINADKDHAYIEWI